MIISEHASNTPHRSCFITVALVSFLLMPFLHLEKGVPTFLCQEKFYTLQQLNTNETLPSPKNVHHLMSPLLTLACTRFQDKVLE